MHSHTVQAQLFQLAVCIVQDGAAGGLINAAGLHTYQTVFYHIDDTNAVFCTFPVQVIQQGGGRQLLTVHLYRGTLYELDLDVGRLVGSILGCVADHQHFILGLIGRILQIHTLVAQVPQVAVHRIVGFLGDGQRNIVCLGIVHSLLTGLNIPLTPGSDDLQVGSQCLYGRLKTNLVVALAGSTVSDSHSTLLAGDLHQTACDQRTGKGSTQQVFALIHRTGLHGRVNIISDELITQILDIQLGCAGLDSFLFQRGKLLALPNVSAHGNYVKAIVLLQPRDDDRGIQATGIRQHYLGFFLFRHFQNLSLKLK